MNLPPCPVCGTQPESLEGFGADTWVEPCGHRVDAIHDAGGVAGAVVLRVPMSQHECDQEGLVVIMDDGYPDHEVCSVCGREWY